MKINSKKVWIGAVVVCIAIGVSLYLMYRSTELKTYRLTITTATEGGTFKLLGDALAVIFGHIPEKPINPVEVNVSSGSVENIRRLKESEADIGFAAGVALLQDQEAQKELRVLARLYKDVLQIVVRRDARIDDLDGIRKFLLNNKNQKIFIGPAGSSTQIFAKHVLEAIGMSDGSYTIDDSGTFSEAADRLQAGDLKVAFFMSGIPTPAVQKALESGDCKLLSVNIEIINSLKENYPELALDKEKIYAGTYENQLDSEQTCSAWTFLICREDIDEDLANLILNTLFDNLTILQEIHPKAQDIKLTEAFNDIPEGLMHPSADRFRIREQSKLLIATGALNGKYYQLGRGIELLLKKWGIDARVVHTDGSLENLELLNKEHPTIAIMQYDAALISFLGRLEDIYKVNLSNDIARVEAIRRIAVLHDEKIHVVADGENLAELERKLGWDEKPIKSLNRLTEALQEIPQEQFRICLGPQNSASQMVAQAILNHHGIHATSYIKESYLSVSDMVNSLQNRETDLGFFTSYVPSEAMKTVLDDNRFRLLSLGAKERSVMAGGIFTASTIERGTYASQPDNEPVQTLATKAVLVTTESLPLDVETITKAIFEGSDVLGIQRLDEVNRLPYSLSLTLHPDAEQYYKKAGIIPSKEPFDWVGAAGSGLACLVIIVSGYKGMLMLRRSRTGNRIARRILAVPLEADFSVSGQKLLNIRDEIQDRVRRRWWRYGELDKSRWRYLVDLIQQRVDEAKGNLTRSFVAEIRSVGKDSSLSDPERIQRYRSIEDRILEYFEKGELDSTQQKILRELLQDCDRKNSTDLA